MVSVAQGHSASRLGSCAQPSGLFKPQAELQVPPSSPEDVRMLPCAAGAMYRGCHVQRVPCAEGACEQRVPCAEGAVCRGCLCAEGACEQRVPVGRGYLWAEDAMCRGCFV